GGLVVIAGRQHMPAKYEKMQTDPQKKSPLAELLPVDFIRVDFPIESDARPQPFNPELTELGERDISKMLWLGDTVEENRQIWRTLRGFHWHYPVPGVRALGSVLLKHPRVKMAGDQPMPLIVSQPVGKGQVLFLACDETWRWRSNTEDKYYARFWRQV